MKWYNWKYKSINLDYVISINFVEKEEMDEEYCHRYRAFIEFHMSTAVTSKIEYKDYAERDAEFEKIKALMGIRDHTSRCC
jgi:hypothetical protein